MDKSTVDEVVKSIQLTAQTARGDGRQRTMPGGHTAGGQWLGRDDASLGLEEQSQMWEEKRPPKKNPS